MRRGSVPYAPPCADIPVALRRRRGLRRGDAHRPQDADVRSCDYPRDRLRDHRCSDGSDDRTVAEARAAGAEQVSTCLAWERSGRSLPRSSTRAAKCSCSATPTPDSSAQRSGSGLELCRRLGRSGGGERGARRRPRTARSSAGARVCTGATRTGPARRGSGRKRRLGGRSSLRDAARALPWAGCSARRRFRHFHAGDPAGYRLAFDRDARVLVQLPSQGRAELRRKVRVMNGGLRPRAPCCRYDCCSIDGIRAPAVVTQDPPSLRRVLPRRGAPGLRGGRYTQRGMVDRARAAVVRSMPRRSSVRSAHGSDCASHVPLAVPYYLCLANSRPPSQS